MSPTTLPSSVLQMPAYVKDGPPSGATRMFSGQYPADRSRLVERGLVGDEWRPAVLDPAR